MSKASRGLPGWWSAGLLAAGLGLAACGASITPTGDGGADSSASEGGVSCALSNGMRCPAGQSCPAGDGCNTCSCSATGMLACTLLACAPADAGPPPVDAGPAPDSGRPGCRTAADCGPTNDCVFRDLAMCGALGVCSPQTDCAPTATFCSCAGRTFMDCPGRPTQPAAAAGACPTNPACTGACAPGGVSVANGLCLGPADNPCPVDCCSNWNCNYLTPPLACGSLMPTCPAGSTASVNNQCWGPCVPIANCAPIACATDTQCPRAMRCEPSAARCVAR